MPFGTTQEVAQAMAMEDPKVQPFAVGKLVVKVIYVPDKLLNIVVKG